MTVPHKITWYFWHLHFKDYAERMAAMAYYVQNSVMHKYHIEDTLKLVPKE